MTACTRCHRPVESSRESYVIPTCFACLPPPLPLAQAGCVCVACMRLNAYQAERFAAAQVTPPAMLDLPAFELLKRQPRCPHERRVIAQGHLVNVHNVEYVVTVASTRRGDRWFVWAAFQGLCGSNTVTTTVAAKAAVWTDAVRTGNVSIAGEPLRRIQPHAPNVLVTR